LTTVLLVGAGLFARSLNNLERMDLGVRAEHLITFSIAPEQNGYTPVRSVALFDQLRESLSALPGVTVVSAAEIPVFTDSNSSSNITAEGYTPHDDEDTNVYHNYVGPDYFSALGIPLIAGREFNRGDTSNGEKTAIVNETMAKRFFAGREAVGSRFTFGSGNVHPDIQIVGIVKDSKHGSVREKARPFVYIPYSQQKTIGRLTYYIKTQQGLGQMAATLRREVQHLDPNLPVFDLKTLDQQIDESLFADKFLTSLSLSFALLAAVLAVIGLYGVMAYTVTRRTREIGIRMALGASRGNVSWLILREVVVLAAIGLVIGLPAAYALGHVTESLLYGVKVSDPIVFAGAALLLSSGTLLGGYLPARRAATTDPLKALRCE